MGDIGSLAPIQSAKQLVSHSQWTTLCFSNNFQAKSFNNVHSSEKISKLS
jgi:hypothetical protein